LGDRGAKPKSMIMLLNTNNKGNNMFKITISICIYILGVIIPSVFAEKYMKIDLESELVGSTPSSWIAQSGIWQVEGVFNNKVYKQVGSTNAGAHSKYSLATAQSDLVVDFSFNINHCKVERVFVYSEKGIAKAVSHAMQETCVYDDNLEAFNLIRTLTE
jgi:hypothetical protein